MTHYDEKREHVRYDLDTSIVYAFQNSDQFKPARLCNYCKGGMCFEAGNAIDPGSDIYIMMEDEPAEQFLVGVKYYQTVIK
jgi:hypothetical protein